ncbi:hypothetical protein DH2020_013743 [Rehmannia glutinosa]|uniref:Uncharacterized protein n=1 Tax=Rehmannia glutinosa TaxID=99300 RepID=A0ABR0X3V1_REHGL
MRRFHLRSAYHTMSDGYWRTSPAAGRYPSIPPVWERQLPSAHDPPHVSFTHREYDVVSTPKEPYPNRLSQRHGATLLLLRPRRDLRPSDPSLHTYGDAPHSSSSRPVSAGRRTIAISRHSMKSLESFRREFSNTIQSATSRGYYGNVFASPQPLSPPPKCCPKIHYITVVELIRKTKPR